MTLRGVIFDMGGTLLNYHPADAAPQAGWQAMEDYGAEALYTYLDGQGYTLPDRATAVAENFAIMERHWRQLGPQRTHNPRLSTMLHEVLTTWGLPEADLRNGLMDKAMAAYVAPVQGYVTPLAGAQETLWALHDQGLRLGLFSNTVWPGDYHRADLAQHGLLEDLDCTFFSADVDVWKPEARAFQLPLEALDLAPEEAVYVGDHPYFDVYGAQQAGLRGVWMCASTCI